MALKEDQVFVTSGKKKGQCSNGTQCSFQHESNDRAQKPTPNAATLNDTRAYRKLATKTVRIQHEQQHEH